MTDLVMLSGGIDSAWCLKHVLETSKNPVAVCHVRLSGSLYNSNFSRLQYKATRDICDHLTYKYGEFERFDINYSSPYHCGPMAWIIAAPLASVLMYRPDIKRVFWGECKEEMDDYDPGGFAVSKALVKAHLNAPEMDICVEKGYFPYPRRKMPQYLRPGVKKTKYELAEELGWDLVAKTHSCFNPTILNNNILVCKKCAHCKHRSQVDAELLRRKHERIGNA